MCIKIFLRVLDILGYYRVDQTLLDVFIGFIARLETIEVVVKVFLIQGETYGDHEAVFPLVIAWKLGEVQRTYRVLKFCVRVHLTFLGIPLDFIVPDHMLL